MGGSLGLASELGLGSTFSLELELSQDTDFYGRHEARPRLKVRPILWAAGVIGG